MNHSLGLLPSSLFPLPSCLPNNISSTELGNPRKLPKVLGIRRCIRSESRYLLGQLSRFKDKFRVQVEAKNCDTGDNLLLHVQTLRNFPIEKLYGEVAVVRFDSSLILEQFCISNPAVNRALFTIRYLYNAGAKLLLISNWCLLNDSNLSTQSFADHLSKLLQIKVRPANVILDIMQSKAKDIKKPDILLLDNLAKFREELTNCPEFSRKLSSGAYIFVNDAFSLSHKILASTVGISRFCDASVAGFHFEEELLQLTKAIKTTRQPYIAIIGGSKFLEKAPVLRLLASTCDGLIFVGKLVFQIMHAVGMSIPACFLEHDATGEALKLIQLAQSRRIPVYYPDDLCCSNNCNPESLEIFPSDGIMAGWTPVVLGPGSLKEIFALLSNCKKVLWIGPVIFDPSVIYTDGESKLALMLERISNNDCEVTVVGNAACKAIHKHSSHLSSSSYKVFKSASVVWEFLKGRTLPGVAALDRAYPFHIDWNTIFPNPAQPLIVDIGSGNGFFLLNMASRSKHSNFLGLEINDKLVKCCQQSILETGIKNVYFISTNATSSFRSIISSYPGALVLTSIQCPNPDFNREKHRWRMVQRILVEAIVDFLIPNGEIFLQSDVEAVAVRMKEEFMMYGEDTLVVDGADDEEGWLSDNPFGVRSDWEQHVIDRGGRMYRVMLRKFSGHLSNR